MTEAEQSLATINPSPVSEFNNSYVALQKFVKSKLKLDTDYGIIPGTEKKSLFKPGAEKIAFLFNLKPHLELIKEVEDWEKGFFFYKYKCTLLHFHTGKNAGEAVRSCNSKEKKYATTSKAEKWATAEEKAAAIGRKTVKKGQWENVYLILRKTPEEAAEQANTIDAMAQKRAIVAAVVQATMATEIFDADISESDEEAPNKSVSKEEDPRRNKIIMRLYVTGSEHGWDDEWIHRAIAKKWEVESITNLSNEQIEELTEFIASKYKPVGKGNKPELLVSPTPAESGPVSTSSVQDGEVVEEITRPCPGPKHKGQKEEDVPQCPPGDFCSTACQDDYYPPKSDRPWENPKKNTAGISSATS